MWMEGAGGCCGDGDGCPGGGRRWRAASAGVRKLRTSVAVSAGSGGRRPGGPWEVPLVTSRVWRRRHDVRRRDIVTVLHGAGLSNAPHVRQRVPPRVLSWITSKLTTDWVSECAYSEWNVPSRMRILLSELGLSGACLGLTLEPCATPLDPDKPAPGQRPQHSARPTTSVFIFAFVV